jgi:predicted methyltransferase
MKIQYTLLICGLLSACTSSSEAPETKAASEVKPAITAENLPKTLEEALASPFRSPLNLPRDVYRHPVETLNFFGIKPTMTVVEISPGGGWYAEILAPYLSLQGKYIAALAPPEKGGYAKTNFDKFTSWVKSHPALVVQYGQFSPPELLNIAEAGSADMVLTFRNVHNWMGNGAEEKAFQAFFAALKPGGILGVEEHRADKKAKTDPKAESGYVKESEVIRMATKAGFKLEAKSEINANPKDTKNHPKGVWTLPPTLALKDQDRAKYLAIGESDRMTLRFVKPKK